MGPICYKSLLIRVNGKNNMFAFNYIDKKCDCEILDGYIVLYIKRDKLNMYRQIKYISQIM